MSECATSSIETQNLFKPFLKKAFVISQLSASVGLTPVVFSLVVYDKIIASGSIKGLTQLMCGVGLIVLFDILLRKKRSVILVSLATKLHNNVTPDIFEKLVFLPQITLDRLNLTSQLSRFRDYDAVKEFLTSSLVIAILELPMIIAYLLVTGLVCGIFVYVPLLFIFLYVCIGIYAFRSLRVVSANTAKTASKKNAFLIEVLEKHEHVCACGLQNRWMERWKDLSQNSNKAAMRSTVQALKLDKINSTITTCGVIFGLWVGVYGVIHLQFTIGEMIAAMMLLWRILIPIQQICSSLCRLKQISDCHGQLQNLSATQVETETTKSLEKERLSSLQLQRLTLRYDGQIHPALLNINLNILCGERIAICGASGSGKTTLLHAMMGLYQAQAGTIHFNEKDIRQFSKTFFCQSMCFISQTPTSIEGNLRIFLENGDPTHTDNEIYSALEAVGSLETVLACPNTIDTDFTHETNLWLSQSDIRKLYLARACLHSADLFFIDDFSSSSTDLINATQQFLKRLSDHKTAVVVTQSQSLLANVQRAYGMRCGELFPLNLEKTDS